MKHDLLKASLILIAATAVCQAAIGSPKEAAKKQVENKPTAKQAEVKKADENNPRFQKQMLDVAAGYYKYQKYDDNLRRAPWLCAMPPPSGPKLSKSKDAGTHGQKVYYVYAKDMASYIANEKAPDGQVLVKESFIPLMGDPDAKPFMGVKDQYKAGEKHGLFIMIRLAPGSAGYKDTDDGWIYGTVTADGKTVTAAGKVQSCMGCHLQAPHGRLFGVPSASVPSGTVKPSGDKPGPIQ